MYPSFTQQLRKRGIPATPDNFLDLIEGISQGFAPTLGDLYLLGQATYVKRPENLVNFQKAFFEYFFGITAIGDQSLDQAIIESDQFKSWVEERNLKDDTLSRQVFVENLLEGGTLERKLFEEEAAKELQLSDKKQPFNPRKHAGVEGLNPESTLRGSLLDTGGYTVSDNHTSDELNFERVSDSLMEQRLSELLNAQKERHEGGTQWIGTKGSSAFGNNGFSKYGIRIGGKSKFGTARRVISNEEHLSSSRGVPRVKGYEAGDMQEILRDLRLWDKSGVKKDLNLGQTVYRAGKTGYIRPVFDRREVDRMEVMLFIDNGGKSMNQHVPVVQKLFAKMAAQLKSLETFYFHNCIYEHTFSDSRRQSPISLGEIVARDHQSRVIVVGDASMNPNREVNKDTLGRLRSAFQYSVWLNPVPEKNWSHVNSIGMIREIFPMFELTTYGLRGAVEYLNNGNTPKK